MSHLEMVLGIDIGGTNTAFGLVDSRGKVRSKGSIPTLPSAPAEQLFERLHTVIEESRRALPATHRLTGVGIGAPNANAARGTIENPVNLSWGPSTDLVRLVRRYYQLPVALTNDANAAAIGEMLYGGAQGMKDLIVITLGTGLGSGIIANGRLISGADGFAGELGHTTVDPEGRACACGKRGCLETYVSAPGLCRTTLALLTERSSPSPLRSIPPQELTAERISAAATNGDPLALTAFDQSARILAMKLADAVALTGPEAIFVGGGLAAAGDLLLVPARRYLEEFLFLPYRGKVRLLLSGLTDENAAILGAAALIWQGRTRP